MKSKKNMKKIISNIVGTIALPVAVFIIMEVLVYSKTGNHLLGSVLDIRNLVRDVGISAIIAFGLSLNLASGRFDLSLGAQRLVATIIGGNLAINLGLNGVGLLLFAVGFGLLAGFIVGYIFITFRIPPVVLGLGMALIYESIAFAGSNGQGLAFFGVKNMDMLVDPTFTLIVLGIATVFVFVLVTFTKFRYEMQAMRGSQKIAIDSGINVFRHVLICYTFAGALVAISGVLDSAFTGSMATQLGMSSNSTVVAMSFPMFIGIYLSRRSNIAIGIILGTLSVKFFSTGLVALKLSNSVTSTISMIMFISFLAFLANQDLPRLRRAQKERIRLALKKKKELQMNIGGELQTD